MPFLLVFNKATDAAETLLLFTVCPDFLEVHSSLSLSCKFSSLGWKHCSRHDLILLNISERDSLFSQCLLEALVRVKLEEKSIVWEELEKPFSISGSICFRTGSCSVDIRSIMTLKRNTKPNIIGKNFNVFSVPSLLPCTTKTRSKQFTFHLCQFASLQILYIFLGPWVL